MFNKMRFSHTVQDCLFLSLVVLLSCILYVWGLGFYSDDWGFLEKFSTYTDQSLMVIFRSAYLSDANFWMRPVQVIYLAALYFLFGFNPLGYHLVNSTILLLGVLLFYLVLCELCQPRLLSLAVPVVYALLPHYSSDRFWFAAFQATLSMALYFLSLYSNLRALQSQSLSLWSWQWLSILSLIASTLAYEVFLPLFLFNILLIWHRRRKLYDNLENKHLLRSKRLILFGSSLLALILVIVFKGLVSLPSGRVRSQISSCISQGRQDCLSIKTVFMERIVGLFNLGSKLLPDHLTLVLLAVGGGLGLIIFSYFYYRQKASQVRVKLPKLTRKLKFIVLGLVVFGLGNTVFLIQTYSIKNPTSLMGRAMTWWVQLAQTTLVTSYGDYGLGLPHILWRILHDYASWTVLTVGGLLGLVIWGYLYRVVLRLKTERLTQASMLKLIGLGLVFFGLGYAIFLTNRSVIITSTGLGNRVAIAAAIGVALSLVGGIGWVSYFLPSERSRKTCFCTLIALLCISGFLINNTLADFWITAYHKQQEILADLPQELPTIPPGSTVFLDGICPYIGPAPVFEGSLGWTPALQLLYRDRTLKGDVVKSRMKVKENGVSTRFYGVESLYPYEKLFVYNFSRKITYQLTDAKAARLYFQIFNPDRNSGCPPIYEGYGTSVF